MRFALQLIQDFGYEQAEHVITYGLKAAAETNYNARFFQGYEQYVPEAIADFEKHQQREQQKQRRQQQELEEQEAEFEDTRQYYEKPIDERLNLKLRIFHTRIQTFHHRKPTEEEEAAERKKWLAIKERDEGTFREQEAQRKALRKSA